MKSKDKEKAKIEYQQKLEKEKEAEIDILNAIRHGDLKKLESFPFNSEGIDTHLSPSVETIVYPSISHSSSIESIIGPTAVIYSILCEQPDILTFFLTKFNPDLTETVDGWSPLHFACATKDVSCLKILLSTRFIQKNINMAVLTEEESNDEHFTTGLYIAVMHGNYETVLILTQQHFQVAIPTPLKVNYKNQIKTSIRAATGMTPLHAAVRNNDWDMCQILLNCADCDITITDDQGNSPYDLAKNLNLENIVKKFESGQVETREVLESRYAQKLSREEKSFLNQVEDKIDNMNKRLMRIEDMQEDLGICSLCEVNIGKLCPDCNQIICKTCWTIPIHRCKTKF